MEKRRENFREGYQEMKRRTYGEAITQAWELLQALGKKGRVEVEFLDKNYAVDFEKRTLVKAKKDLPVKEYHTVLILHYLAKERAVSLPAEISWRSFGDFESGKFYYPAFAQRSLDRLNREYSQNPEALWESARGLKRRKLDLGDFSFQVQVFPKIFVALIYWQGDEELSPQFDLLFNPEVGQIYPIEDIVVLAQSVVSRLVHAPPPAGP